MQATDCTFSFTLLEFFPLCDNAFRRQLGSCPKHQCFVHSLGMLAKRRTSRRMMDRWEGGHVTTTSVNQRCGKPQGHIGYKRERCRQPFSLSAKAISLYKVACAVHPSTATGCCLPALTAQSPFQLHFINPPPFFPLTLSPFVHFCLPHYRPTMQPRASHPPLPYCQPCADDSSRLYIT